MSELATALLIFFGALGLCIYGIWQPPLRIKRPDYEIRNLWVRFRGWK